MEKQPQPHDHYFRKMLSNLTIAKDFLRKYLPKHLQTIINFRSIRLCKESFVGKDLSEKVTDILYSVRIQQQEGYIYILVEHQSTPEILMPFRIQEYIVRIMREHLTQTKKNILPIVVPIVFYNGQKNYPYSTDIFDLFGNHKNLAEEFLLKPFQLIDLSKIPDDELRRNTTLGLMEFVMKNIHARDFLLYMERLGSELSTIEQIVGSDYIIATIKYVIEAGNISDPEAFIEIAKNSLSPETGEKLMTVREYLIQKGKQEEAQYVARKLLIRGMNNVEISEITGLSKNEIAKLEIAEKVAA